MLPFHATNKKKACIGHRTNEKKARSSYGQQLVAAGANKKKACSSHGRQLVAARANREKARIRIFCKNYLCNFIGLFVSPAFLLLYSSAPQQG